MNEGRIATRYAKALLLTASRRSDGGRAVYTDAEAMLPQLDSAREELQQILDSVRIPVERKMDIVGGVFDKYAPTLTPFARFVVSRGRGNYLHHALRVFLDLYRQSRGILQAHISLASPLDTDQLSGLTRFLHSKCGSNIEVQTHVNPELIGGFQLRVGDNLYDRSVRGELQAIAASIDV